jgi:ubiquinone/menaquinone biosynthesis C-methylase UbiE
LLIDNSEYLLASGSELERVRLQARMWEPDAARLLDQVGIQSGWTCVDLGCGGYGVLSLLSRRVGPSGRVIGVERDPLQLASGRSYVEEQALANVEIIEGDAYATRLPAGSCNLVHVRFLFAPVGRDDELIREMLSLLPRGGVAVIQEPDSASWSCWPALDSWTQLKEWTLTSFRAGGGDFDAGRRTYQMLVDAGLKDVQVRAVVLGLSSTHPYAGLPVQFARSLKERIVASGLATIARLEEVIHDCEQQLPRIPRLVTSFVVTQVWGGKP